MARSDGTLFRPWKVLGLSILGLFGIVKAYYIFALPLSDFTRNAVGTLGMFFFFGSLALVARNVSFRREDKHFYHPLPKWAVLPFSFLFGFLAVAIIVQLIGYFRLEDLAYIAILAFVTLVGMADLFKTRAILSAL